MRKRWSYTLVAQSVFSDVGDYNVLLLVLPDVRNAKTH